MILRFFSSLLARFAKTFGVIFIVLGFVCAAYLGTTAAPRIESARYRPSQFLSERLSELTSQYDRAKAILLKLRGKTEFPDQYAPANAEPQFRPTYATTSDFIELRKSVDAVASGRSAMKSYVTDTIESLISDIQAKLLAHAQSLHAEDAAGATPSPSPSNSAPVSLQDIESLYDQGVSATARKESLDEAKNYLETLDESAANPDNKKKLETSMAEIDLLETLLPAEPAAPSTAPVPTFDQKASPLPAEKVAAHLAYLREQIQRSMLLEWALDGAYNNAAAAAQSEEQTCAASEFAVRHISEDVHVKMAAAITVGLLLGVFFLLIGDWTQKSLTELLSPPWCQLIKGVSASPKEVYDIIEQHIAAREVPELEITREFWHEGGALSAKREYLRLARERLVFEICAAPSGTGFFVSFRLCEIPLTIDPLAIFILFFVVGLALLALIAICGLMWGGIILLFSLSLLVFLLRTAIARGLGNVDRLLMKTPLIAPLYEMFLRPVTYYRLDTTAMYLQAVQGATAEAFQSIFGDHAVNLLSETVPPPVMESLYRRRSL
jgi:hypothetical protein